MLRFLTSLRSAREFVQGFADDMRRPTRLRSMSPLRLVRERQPAEKTWLIARAVSLKAF